MNKYPNQIDGRKPNDKLALQRRRVRVKMLAQTHTAKMISDEMMVAIGTVRNDLRWNKVHAKRERKSSAGRLGLYQNDPGNAPSAKLTGEQLAERRRLQYAGFSQDEVGELTGRPDLITPALPRRVPSKFGGLKYDEADLLRYFAEAARRGMMDSTIALHLGVTRDRVHYFQGGEGRDFLARRAAI